MHNPLGGWRGVPLVQTTARGRASAQFADNVLSGAMNGEQNEALQPLGLLRGRRLEGLPVRTEPDLDNVVAAHMRIDAASNGFNLWQFRHFSIVWRKTGPEQKQILRSPPPN
jgi:hypothetical protein